MSVFGKTGITIGAVVFTFWVIAPLVLVVVFRMLNTSGGNIDLLIGLLLMVSLAGLAFGLSFAAAAYFKKLWLLLTPIVLLTGYGVVSHFTISNSTHHVKFAPEAAHPATELAERHDVPLETMLHFAIPNMSKQSADALTKVVQGRQVELAKHIAADRSLGNQALYASAMVESPTRELVEAARTHGRSLANSIRRFNELNVATDCAYLAGHYRDRFKAWSTAWVALHQRTGSNGNELVREIAQLASVRAGDCPAMHEIMRAAEATAPRLK